jgi:hypothetical protein
MTTNGSSYFGRAQAATFIALFAFVMAPQSQASSIVAPNANQNVDGDANNIAPFSAGLFGTGPTERYQQVYAASQFAAAGSTFDIGAIAFRLDANDAPGFESDTYPSIQIDLSTTAFGPNGLSSTFANNVGADDHVVYNGSLTLSGAGGQNPNPFNLIVSLQSPFLYTPSQGNLLLDIRINQGGTGFLAALDATSDSAFTSRVRSFNDVASLTGTADTFGLVTQFSTPSGIPEPSALTLCAGGLALLGFRRLSRRCAK